MKEKTKKKSRHQYIAKSQSPMHQENNNLNKQFEKFLILLFILGSYNFARDEERCSSRCYWTLRWTLHTKHTSIEIHTCFCGGSSSPSRLSTSLALVCSSCTVIMSQTAYCSRTQQLLLPTSVAYEFSTSNP